MTLGNSYIQQFHDILPGSAIYESHQNAIGEYKMVQTAANDMRDIGFRRLADEVKTKSGTGQPIVACNLQPVKRQALIEAEIFTYDCPLTAGLAGWADVYGSDRVIAYDHGQGMVPTVMVRDGSGRIYPAQIVWGKLFPPGWRSRIQFLAEIPAGGYKTFYIDASKAGDFNEIIPFINNEFETDYFKIGIDMKNGEITHLYDKRSKTEYADGKNNMNRLRIYMENAKSMDAWTIGKIDRTEDITNVESVSITEKGPVRACVEVVKRWGRSKFIERTYIYRSYPRIDFKLEVHWFEQGNDSTDGPMLRAIFPLSLKNAGLNCQVPFDVVKRPVDGEEVPAQQWADVSDGKAGIALLNKTKYGYSFDKGELKLSLMRSSGGPNIYPNTGKFEISYALYPHQGDWTNNVWTEGEDFNVPVYAAEIPSASLGKEPAGRPEEDSFIALEPAGVVMSGIKQAEDGKELVIRLVEVSGKETNASLTLPEPVKSARRLTILEYPLANVFQPVVKGKTIEVKLRAHEIVTLGILFDKDKK